MAPPDLGSQSEDSQPECGQFEVIQETLKRLEKDSLKLKAKNEKIIHGINIKQNSSKGWIGSAIDVPGSSQPNQRPPRPPIPSSKFLCSQDIDQIMKESEAMKKKMQDTLRACAISREENQRYLEKLKEETRTLCAPVGQSYAPYLPATTKDNSMHGIVDSLKLIGKKLRLKSYKRDDTKGDSMVQVKPTVIANAPTTHPYDCPGQNTEPMPPPIVPRKTRPVIEVVRPQPKPRPRPACPPPQPPPNQFNIDIDKLKTLYLSEEDTLNLSQSSRVPLQRHDSNVSTETTSEFEYFGTPLHVETLPMPDSDDSLILPELSNDQPALVSLECPESRTENIGPKTELEITEEIRESVTITKEMESIVTSIKPIEPTKCSEDFSGTTGASPARMYIPQNDSEQPNYSVPEVEQRLPPLLMEEIPETDLMNSDPIFQSELTTKSGITGNLKTSSLCFGVPIDEIRISILPWTSNKKLEPEDISTSFSNNKPEDDNFQSTELAIKTQTETFEIDTTLYDQENASAFISHEFSYLESALSDPFSSDNSGTEEASHVQEKSCRYHQHSNDQDETFVSEVHQTTSPPPLLKLYPSLEDTQEFIEIQESLEAFPKSQVGECDENNENALIAVSDTSASIHDNVVQISLPPVPPPLPSSSSPFPKYSTMIIKPLEPSKICKTIFAELQPFNISDSSLDLNLIKKTFTITDSPAKGRRSSIVRDQVDVERTLPLISLNTRKKIEIGDKHINLQESQEKVLKAVKTLSPDALGLEEVQVLLQMIPKEEEKSQFVSLRSESHTNVPGSYKAIGKIVEIPRYEKKLETLAFLLSFENCLESLTHRINLLAEANVSVRTSEKFRTLLSLILGMVNKVADVDACEIQGFDIRSVDRLCRKNSTSMSPLNCILKVAQDEVPEALQFAEDFKHLLEASHISYTDMEKGFQELASELDEMKEEIEKTVTETVVEDHDLKTSLIKTQTLARTISDQFQEAFASWKVLLQELKGSCEFFALFDIPNQELISFFSIVKNFTDTVKRAEAENERKKKTATTIPECSATFDPQPGISKEELDRAKLKPFAKRQNRKSLSHINQGIAEGSGNELFGVLMEFNSGSDGNLSKPRSAQNKENRTRKRNSIATSVVLRREQ